jgi:hypothetical protein
MRLSLERGTLDEDALEILHGNGTPHWRRPHIHDVLATGRLAPRQGHRAPTWLDCYLAKPELLGRSALFTAISYFNVVRNGFIVMAYDL